MNPDHDAPIPVTLLTGFLGSGKTTVLNHLVRVLPRTAILMNEFGEVALDHQLLEKMDGPMALLSGGCVCCTISGSLSPTLKNLWMARQKGDVPAFERVIIETTGIADPAPVLDNLLNDRWLRARFRLDGVVTTVDALFGMGQLDEHFEAVKQVSVADRLLLTKTDLAPADTVAALTARLASLNPAAEIVTVTNGEIDPARIQNLGLWNAETKSADVARWLAPWWLRLSSWMISTRFWVWPTRKNSPRCGVRSSTMKFAPRRCAVRSLGPRSKKLTA